MTQLFVDTLANEAGTGPTELTGQSAAKAWARYDMAAASINDDLNVGSLTDNGPGDFTLNFTNNMADSNYSFFLSCGRNYNSGSFDGDFHFQQYDAVAAPAVGSVRVLARSVSADAGRDLDRATTSIHGTLA
jgi:hypothetical protein